MKAMLTAPWIAAARLGIPALIYVFQDRLRYFSRRATVEQVASPGLQPWPSAQDFRGLFAEPAGAARGTAIVFHGNAGQAGHRAFYAQALTPLGWRVILAEYPGYGPRAGRPGERSLVDDASQTVALAHHQYGEPLLLAGESLGAAVVAAAGQRQQERTAVLLMITPWDRFAHVASHHCPWLPAKWLLRDPCDTAARLAQFDRPVVVAVAGQDSIVSAGFGIALHGPKHLMQIDGAGHNDWPERVDASWWRAAMSQAQ